MKQDEDQEECLQSFFSSNPSLAASLPSGNSLSFGFSDHTDNSNQSLRTNIVANLPSFRNIVLATDPDHSDVLANQSSVLQAANASLPSSIPSSTNQPSENLSDLDQLSAILNHLIDSGTDIPSELLSQFYSPTKNASVPLSSLTISSSNQTSQRGNQSQTELSDDSLFPAFHNHTATLNAHEPDDHINQLSTGLPTKDTSQSSFAPKNTNQFIQRGDESQTQVTNNNLFISVFNPAPASRSNPYIFGDHINQCPLSTRGESNPSLTPLGASQLVSNDTQSLRELTDTSTSQLNTNPGQSCEHVNQFSIPRRNTSLPRSAFRKSNKFRKRGDQTQGVGHDDLSTISTNPALGIPLNVHLSNDHVNQPTLPIGNAGQSLLVPTGGNLFSTRDNQSSVVMAWPNQFKPTTSKVSFTASNIGLTNDSDNSCPLPTRNTSLSSSAPTLAKKNCRRGKDNRSSLELADINSYRPTDFLAPWTTPSNSNQSRGTVDQSSIQALTRNASMPSLISSNSDQSQGGTDTNLFRAPSATALNSYRSTNSINNAPQQALVTQRRNPSQKGVSNARQFISCADQTSAANASQSNSFLNSQGETSNLISSNSLSRTQNCNSHDTTVDQILNPTGRIHREYLIPANQSALPSTNRTPGCKSSTSRDDQRYRQLTAKPGLSYNPLPFTSVQSATATSISTSTHSTLSTSANHMNTLQASIADSDILTQQAVSNNETFSIQLPPSYSQWLDEIGVIDSFLQSPAVSMSITIETPVVNRSYSPRLLPTKSDFQPPTVTMNNISSPPSSSQLFRHHRQTRVKGNSTVAPSGNITILSGNNNIAPTGNNTVVPDNNTTASGINTTAPAGNISILSGYNTTAPSNNTISQVNNTIVLSNNTIAPAGSISILSGYNTSAPANNTIIPGNNTLTPSNNTISQVNNTIAPGNNTFAPSNNTISQVNNTIAPTGSISILSGYNTSGPTNSTIISGNNTLTPSNNTISPVNNTIAPGDNNTLTPGNNIIAPIPSPATQAALPQSYFPTPQELGIIPDKAKRPEKALRHKRLETFTDWPADRKQTKEELAKAGFFYTGYVDAVRCFFCGGGLRNWMPWDNVWVEHARLFPKCSFIQQKLGHEFIDTVKRLAKRYENVSFGMVLGNMTKDKERFSKESKRISLLKDPAVEALCAVGFSEEDVLNVAESLKLTGDTISSDIMYTMLVERGAELKKPIGLKQQRNIENPGPSYSGNRDKKERKEKLETLKEENQELRAQTTCKVCMEQQVSFVFLPCGHLVCCYECACAMKDCPVCRKDILGMVRATIG